MEITLNGRPHQIAGLISIRELLLNLDLLEQKIAVEQNLEIVPRSDWASQNIKAGDRIEIIDFVGGG